MHGSECGIQVRPMLSGATTSDRMKVEGRVRLLFLEDSSLARISGSCCHGNTGGIPGQWPSRTKGNRTCEEVEQMCSPLYLFVLSLFGGLILIKNEYSRMFGSSKYHLFGLRPCLKKEGLSTEHNSCCLLPLCWPGHSSLGSQALELQL